VFHRFITVRLRKQGGESIAGQSLRLSPKRERRGERSFAKILENLEKDVINYITTQGKPEWRETACGY
jgi:hypothetical protein